MTNSYQGRPDFKGPWRSVRKEPGQGFVTQDITDASGKCVAWVRPDVAPLVELAPSLYLGIVATMDAIERGYPEGTTMPPHVAEAYSLVYGMMKSVEKGMAERG